MLVTKVVVAVTLVVTIACDIFILLKKKSINMGKLHLLPNLGNKAIHPVNTANDRIWHVTSSVNWVKLLEKVEFFPHRYSEHHWPKLFFICNIYPLKSYFKHCLQQKFNWKEFLKCLSLFFLPFLTYRLCICALKWQSYLFFPKCLIFISFLIPLILFSQFY